MSAARIVVFGDVFRMIPVKRYGDGSESFSGVPDGDPTLSAGRERHPIGGER
jgi:hypothetical protein